MPLFRSLTKLFPPEIPMARLADRGIDAAAVSAAQRVKLLTRVAAFYHQTLLNVPEGLRYLTKVRGLREAALFKTFQIGFANGSLLDALPKDGETVAQLKTLGVLTPAGRELFHGCVVFPLWSADGAIVNLCGRSIAEGEASDLYLPGDRLGLWNYQACKRSAAIVLTDSVLDALTVVDRGLLDTMPCTDERGLSDEQLRLCRQCGVQQIVLAFGATDAGRRNAEAVSRQLNQDGFAVAAVSLPEGEDVSSYLTGRHSDEAQRALQAKVAEAFASLKVRGDSTAIAVPGERFERTAHGFKLALHGRSYEVKGIARETTQLKATIKASGDPNKGFELTTLDLYSARSREAYAKVCMASFGATETVIKADLARVLERVEAWVTEPAGSEPAPVSSPEDTARALAFLTQADLFGEILADLKTLGVAGEETNKLLCYLAVVSRKLDDPLSLLIQSRSASGKSTLQHAVLALAPDEDKVLYTRLTSQTLFYRDEMSLAHKVLALEETEGLGEAAYSLRALQSAKQITISTTIKDPLTGKLRADQCTVQGPVAVLLTTTAPSLDEETASRFLTLTIDESREMTETILATQRHHDTLAGYLAELDRAAVIAKHHAAQRLLEPLVVINPYAEQLSFPAHSLRARRDHKKYLMLIKAIAFLHQKQRTVREAERGGKTFRYIEVTKDDIRRANDLAARALGTSLDELSAPARNLLKQIHVMVKSQCEAHNIAPAQYVFTRRDIREATGWTEWQVRIHAKELEDLEYLKARTGTWGREYVYELTWDEDADAANHGLVLADPGCLTESA